MGSDQESAERRLYDRLWIAFMNGEDDAFSHLYLSLRPRLLHYGIKLCQDKELIEDCIQDLFYQLYFLGQQQKPIENIQVYVFVSLRRKVLSNIQKQRKLKQLFPSEKEAIQIVFSQEDLVIADEQQASQGLQLTYMLNQLSPRQREIIYLRYYNGLDNGEIAEVLNISYQVVQNMVYKAFKKLRLVASDKKIQNFS